LDFASSYAGEYVTLYQQQRSAMRRRFEEREGYIYQLARERIDLQTKLGELQALVVQLLGERNMLHAYTRSSGISHPPDSALTSQSAGLANHVTPSPAKRQRREKASRSRNAEGSPADGKLRMLLLHLATPCGLSTL
jgi:Putative golgin subfamily A member 2-like protein 5